MTEPIAEHLTEQASRDTNATSVAATEPAWALLAGGAFGALCFFLCALLFGARWAIAIAAVAAITVLLKRPRMAAIAFIAAGALAAIGVGTSTTITFIASLAFAVGLALAAREYWHHRSSDDAI